jgi:Transposase DDE domain
VNSPSPRKLWKYVHHRLHLAPFFRRPGDGRPRPRIPAKDLLWSQVLGRILRQHSFHGLETLVESPARRNMQVSRSFGDDALGYFNERLDPEPVRGALAQSARQAKRNKAFRHHHLIGLAVDGTGAGHSFSLKPLCTLCRPLKDSQQQIIGQIHSLTMVSVVGVGITLPQDVEPYGPGDSEYSAGLRVLARVIKKLGPRFADYAVADGKFAAAPFLNQLDQFGLFAVVRLKGNLPELFNAAQKRFLHQAPHRVYRHEGERIEVWDADDFDPWEGLNWKTVRVLRYRQHKRNGDIVEAFWLTNFPTKRVGSLKLFEIAKSRWEIENQGFNDGKNRYGMEHICHHEANSILIGWLIAILAMVIERLFRLCYLHRGTHPVRSAIDLMRLMWLALGLPTPRGTDTS